MKLSICESPMGCMTTLFVIDFKREGEIYSKTEIGK